MKGVHLGVVGKMIATPVTVAMMVTLLSAPSSPVKRRRISTALSGNRNIVPALTLARYIIGCICSYKLMMTGNEHCHGSAKD
jgi:hypothetical protein